MKQKYISEIFNESDIVADFGTLGSGSGNGSQGTGSKGIDLEVVGQNLCFQAHFLAMDKSRLEHLFSHRTVLNL